jgi:hypothetical protein
MMCAPCRSRDLLLLSVILIAGCSKKDSDAPASPPGSSPPAATTAPTTAPDTTRPSADPGDNDGARPLREMVDSRLRPSVYLAVNNRSRLELPQGWPLIIDASIFGGRDEAISCTPDDLTLAVTDTNGAPVAWPMKRAVSHPSTRPASAPALTITLMATDSAAAHVGWVLSDSGAIPPGAYRLVATLKGGARGGAEVKVVAAPAQLSEGQERAKFAARARAALALGDAQSALDQADQRLGARSGDLPALHVRADALAALGRKDEAIAAYGKALDAFYAQHPNPPEPPLTLLRSLREVGGGK